MSGEGEAGIEVNRRSPPEGGEDGRRDQVAAGGTTTTIREQAPRSDPPGRFRTVDRTPIGAAWRAHTDGNWAPARGNTCGSVGAGESGEKSHASRHHGLRGRDVGRRPSAVGQKSESSRNLVVGLASLVAVQGNGWGWRHVQGIGNGTAGAHDID